MAMRWALLAALSVLASSCSAGIEPARSDLTGSEERWLERVQVFHESAHFCAVRMIGTQTMTEELAFALGDEGLRTYQQWEAAGNTIQGGPHQGEAFERNAAFASNACFVSVSVESAGFGPAIQDGFCRADFNYCLGQELLFRAGSTQYGPAEGANRVGLLRLGRERLQASAAEYTASLAHYTGACAQASPTPATQWECGRLDAGYADVALARLGDAVPAIHGAAEAELRELLALADGLAIGADVEDAEALVDAVWGPQGLRTNAVEVVYGAADEVSFTSDLTLRPNADVALPLGSLDDERAVQALQLLSEFDIPLGISTSGFTDAPLPQLTTLGWWDNPDAVRFVYNYLDHRLAATRLVGRYAGPDDPSAPAPDPDALAFGEQLRDRTPLLPADSIFLRDTPLAPTLSPLQQEYQLSEENIADALRLFADAKDVNDLQYVRRPQLFDGPAVFYAARIARAISRPALRLHGAAADDSTAGRADALATRMGPVPRDGRREASEENWYAWDLSRLDVSQRVSVVEAPPAPELGAAHALHQLRVHLLRMMTLASPFAPPEELSSIVDFVDAAVGRVWTELDQREDGECFCVDLPGVDCKEVADPYQHPFYTPCASCSCGLVVETLPGVVHWEVYYEGGEYPSAGEAYGARTWDEVSCLVRGLIPGTDVGCPLLPVALPEVGVETSTSVGKLRRRFTLPSPGPNGNLGANAYVLWRDPDGSFALVDIVDTARSASVHPLGGSLEVQAASASRRDPWRPAAPAVTALGLARAYVPPLEGELTSDGDAFEDSFARYLLEARVAAQTAAAQLSLARDAELGARLEEVSDEAAFAQAALGETERVSELCGTRGDCDEPVIGAGVTLGSAGLVPEAAPVVDAEGAPVDCDAFMDTLFTEYRPEEFSDRDLTPRAQHIQGHLNTGSACAQYQVLAVLQDLELTGVPRAALDEVQRGGGGAFADREGQLREELIGAFQTLAEIETSIRSFRSEAAALRFQIDAGALTVAALTVSDKDEARCRAQRWLGGISDVASLASNVGQFGQGVRQGGQSDSGRTAGSQQWRSNASSARGAGANMTGIGNRMMAAGQRGCGDDFAARNAAAETLQQISQRFEAFRAVGLQGARAVAQLYQLASRVELLATEAELARGRRAGAERLASVDGLADQPEWRVLASFRGRRAQRSLARAQEAALIARRAIEFRLGVSMPSMFEPEPFVPPPAFWCDDVFDVERGVEAGVGPDGEPRTVSVAGEAIQDYVQRLEDFVEGYPFERRFRDETDQQVLNVTGLVGAPDGTPAYEVLLFQCAEHPEPLLAGRLPGAEPGPPCEGLGEVLRAEVLLHFPGVLGPYLSSRLAAGNFNYRVESLAVNLDGSALLDCRRASSPEECFADANVPFGLVQSGDVLISNFEHGLEVFAMEPGRVRNGRALAAERVLTNPLSGADAALLTTYLRGELRGRPLRGVYTLSIPGRPEIEWQALREIQVLLNYRFWVRQD